MIKHLTITTLLLTSACFSAAKSDIYQTHPIFKESYILEQLQTRTARSTHGELGVNHALHDALWAGHVKIVEYLLSDAIPADLRPTKETIFELYQQILAQPYLWGKPGVGEISELLLARIPEELMSTLPYLI